MAKDVKRKTLRNVINFEIVPGLNARSLPVSLRRAFRRAHSRPSGDASEKPLSHRDIDPQNAYSTKVLSFDFFDSFD